MVWEELRQDLIFTDVEAASTDDVFDQLGGVLAKKGYAKDTYVQALKDREAEYPTGLDIDGIGVAIPHTPVDYVNNSVVCIGILKDTVPFEDMGGEEEKVPVKLVFMLCFTDPNAHIDQLQRIVGIIQDRKVMQELTEVKNPQEIIDVIHRKEDEIEREEN